MKYDANIEKQRILSQYARNNGMIPVVESLTTSLGQIFQACEKVGTSGIEAVLVSVINEDSHLAQEFEKNLRMTGRVEEASQVKAGLEHIRSIQEQGIETKNIIFHHLKDIIQRIKQEKEEFATLLQQKFKEDAAKSLKGELGDVRNSESYKLLGKFLK